MLSIRTSLIQSTRLIGVVVLLSISLSYFLVGQNYYLLFGIIAIILGIALIKSKMLPLIMILLIIPFVDWAVEYKILPFQIMWLPELLSGLLLVKAVIYKASERLTLNLFGSSLAMVFLLSAIFSLFLNDSGLVPGLLMLRLLFRYYLLFLAVINLGLNEPPMKLTINIIVFVFLVQIPLSLVKLFKFGQGETSLGLSSHSVTTIFPLVAIGYLGALYIFYKRNPTYILYMFAFVGFSIIGGKRAFIFFLPILLFYLAWVVRKNFVFKPSLIFLGILIIFISLYFVARLIPTLNPQREIWGDFSLKHIVNYAVEYETGVTKTGVPIGRISATSEIFRSLKSKGFSGFVFGYGPGTIIKSMFSDYDRREAVKSRFGIGYGLNGLSWLGIQVGYFGVFVYFYFFYLFFRKARAYLEIEQDPYWKSFALGMVGFNFIFIITSLVYVPFFSHDAVAAFYFCLSGIIMLRHEFLRKNQLKAS